MTWPAAQSKTNFDQSSDDPKSARSDLAGNVDKFNQLQGHVSSYIQGFLDDADAAAARTTLGLVIGTDVQALDATLTSLAAVAGVAGDILYASGTDVWARLAKGTDGEILTLASGIPSWAAQNITLTPETALSTTSGTTKAFTGLSAGLNRISIVLNGVSLSGTDEILIQIGDSGGFETSSYVSSASASSTPEVNTSGFVVTLQNAAVDVNYGIIVLDRVSSNIWLSSGNTLGRSDDLVVNSAGRKSLSAELTQVQLLTSGSDTFDAGSVNIFTE